MMQNTEKPTRLLLIEDNKTDIEAVRRALSQAKRGSYVVVAVTTLAAGMRRLRCEFFHAVLLDLELPDCGGLQTFDLVNDAADGLPIIVLTGHDDDATAEAALKRGAQDYVSKGQFDSDSLARAVRYAIERKRLMQDLQHANDFLEQRVEERTAQIEELATGMAHELNQPLQSILGFSSAASMLAASPSNQNEVDELLGEIRAQAEHAGSLIERLRQMINRSDQPRSEFSVNDLVRDVSRLWERVLEQSNIELELTLCDHEWVLSGDWIQLHQVLSNLVQNASHALQLTDNEWKRIRIDTRLLASNDLCDRCVIEVSDNGCGIADEIKSSLFDPFATTQRDGLGLGLSICRTIVERHHGSIELVCDRPGQTTFRVTLPFASSGDQLDSNKHDSFGRSVSGSPPLADASAVSFLSRSLSAASSS